jgi:hypothetical protein
MLAKIIIIQITLQKITNALKEIYNWKNSMKTKIIFSNNNLYKIFKTVNKFYLF